MKTYIQNFDIYFNERSINQEKATDWLVEYHGCDFKELFDRYAVKADYIQSRHVYADGVSDLPIQYQALYSLKEENRPTLNMRSDRAQEVVDDIFKYFYQHEITAPQHINHVSCTHYQSPSGAQKMVVAKEWNDQTTVTHLYHMGCYAAMPAVRVSKAYVADSASVVDVVHTELCSFHLDKENITPEQIIMKTLFADGAIKYSVTNEQLFVDSKKDGLEILAQKEVMVSGTENEMTWRLGAYGFLMTLTRKVPIILAKNIEKYMRDIFQRAGLDFDKDKENTIFAIHPGGPKIIELVEKVLKLNERQVKHSKKILSTRGNMSSATIPHIWNEILEDDTVDDQTNIVSVAFGPGLTMTGVMLKVCRQ